MEYLVPEWEWYKHFTYWDCSPAPSFPFLNSLYHTHPPKQHPWTSCCSWNSPSSLWPLYSFFSLSSAQQSPLGHAVMVLLQHFREALWELPLEATLHMQTLTYSLHYIIQIRKTCLIFVYLCLIPSIVSFLWTRHSHSVSCIVEHSYLSILCLLFVYGFAKWVLYFVHSYFMLYKTYWALYTYLSTHNTQTYIYLVVSIFNHLCLFNIWSVISKWHIFMKGIHTYLLRGRHGDSIFSILTETTEEVVIAGNSFLIPGEPKWDVP